MHKEDPGKVYWVNEVLNFCEQIREAPSAGGDVFSSGFLRLFVVLDVRDTKQ